MLDARVDGVVGAHHNASLAPSKSAVCGGVQMVAGRRQESLGQEAPVTKHKAQGQEATFSRREEKANRRELRNDDRNMVWEFATPPSTCQKKSAPFRNGRLI